MSGIFIRGGVCNEAYTDEACHRRVRFILAAAMSVENRSVVLRTLSSLLGAHDYLRGVGDCGESGVSQPRARCLAAAAWAAAPLRDAHFGRFLPLSSPSLSTANIKVPPALQTRCGSHRLPSGQVLDREHCLDET